MKKQVATIATAAFLSTTISTTVSANTYVVKKGDTLSAIAKQHNTTVQNLKTLNQLTSDLIYINQTLTISAQASNSPNIQPVVSTPAQPSKYTVVSGDSLIKIANKHGISLAELKSWNNIESTLIYPGQVFIVSKSDAPAPSPAPTPAPVPIPTPVISPAPGNEGSIYTIKSGDTLGAIGHQYGLSVADLKSLNNLTSDLIFPGQKLKVSFAQQTTAPSTPTPVPVNNPQTAAPVGNFVSQIVNIAKSLNGVPYAWGGSSVSGFDCSGFIYYVFNKAGKSMNRLSAEGYYDRSYYIDSPQVGDLVFFENTYKQGISHLGIYVGNNEFIHADSSGVRITNLDNPYYKQHFESFKRFY
ncbi:LysM peptidoglycan-binding domain-containing protein [Bacillus sp. 03113]|uniref:C40 family peptidase n=1 Tax=Bacillus sp. 03113 TaxID=2578211 RepID=UPI001143473C|nr:peptidoglycan endopeptidase [Bacillus sp. 03113]